MIALARQQEAEHPQGIRYLVGDGRNLQLNEEHDLVVAAYLAQLCGESGRSRAMLNGIARCLKSGGRFVTINSNPACDFPTAPSFRKYGFETRVPASGGRARRTTGFFNLAEGALEIENYHLQRLPSRGGLPFRRIQLHPLAPTAPVTQGEAACEEGYWTELLSHPPMICLECVK